MIKKSLRLFALLPLIVVWACQDQDGEEITVSPEYHREDLTIEPPLEEVLNMFTPKRRFDCVEPGESRRIHLGATAFEFNPETGNFDKTCVEGSGFCDGGIGQYLPLCTEDPGWGELQGYLSELNRRLPDCGESPLPPCPDQPSPYDFLTSLPMMTPNTSVTGDEDLVENFSETFSSSDFIFADNDFIYIQFNERGDEQLSGGNFEFESAYSFPEVMHSGLGLENTTIPAGYSAPLFFVEELDAKMVVIAKNHLTAGQEE